MDRNKYLQALRIYPRNRSTPDLIGALIRQLSNSYSMRYAFRDMCMVEKKKEMASNSLHSIINNVFFLIKQIIFVSK